MVERGRLEELEESSSFSLGENADSKQKQLEIIQRENQAPDDYHTWIRDVEDIKIYIISECNREL